MTQSAAAVRAALYAACQSLYASETDTGGAPVLVCLGAPGNYQPDYIVAVAVETRQPIERLSMGPIRERTAEVDVLFSAFVPGDEEHAATAADTCDSLTDALEAWLAANKALGGACMDAWTSNIAGPNPAPVEHPESGSVTGWHASSVLTVTARIVT